MAKSKRGGGGGGGGSSPALIITLIFFILTSGVLGYTTYAGFAEQATLKADKEKAKKDAEVFKEERDYHHFVANVLRSYAGQAIREEGADVGKLGKDRQEFLEGKRYKLPDGGKGTAAKTREEVKTILTQWEAKMPWPAGAKEPSKTFETRLTELENSNNTLAKALEEQKDLLEDEKKKVTSGVAALAKQKTLFKDEVERLNKLIAASDKRPYDNLERCRTRSTSSARRRRRSRPRPWRRRWRPRRRRRPAPSWSWRRRTCWSSWPR